LKELGVGCWWLVVPNPFRPTFGVSPPVDAGRYDLLEQFRIGLVEGPGSPARASRYVGPRGSGTTVLLNRLEVVAGEQGWYVVAETVSDRLTGRLVDQHLPDLLARVDPTATDTEFRSATAFGVLASVSSAIVATKRGRACAPS
jgi:hypothetical protein